MGDLCRHRSPCLVAEVHPELLARLDHLCREHTGYLDEVVQGIDRELTFYVAYLAYIDPLGQTGPLLTYPVVTLSCKAGAERHLRSRSGCSTDEAARHDYHQRLQPRRPGTEACRSRSEQWARRRLRAPSVSLTISRGSLWVPGRRVHLFLCDHVFAHFEKDEDITILVGKLQDELNPLRVDFKGASPPSTFHPQRGLQLHDS